MGKTCFLLPLMVAVLLPTSGATLSADSPNITTDQLALLVVKHHITHDNQNILATNWSTSNSVCNWVGVTCGSRHQRVTAMNFSGMGLVGTIPPHLGNLSFLAWFDISNNSFHGSLPFELANLQRLKYLNFENNSFSGEIQSWLGSFTKLQSLYLGHNKFTGFIPSTLGNLSKLEMLSLYNDDHLKGQIPVALGNLSNLKYLYLDRNRLSGSLPSGIFDQLPKLKEIYLNWNLITGRIPNGLFKCKELNIISLSHNSLEGNVPMEIRNLTVLKNFFLGWNNLKGLILSSIFNISSLEEVSLGYNKFSGHLSSDMFDHLPRLRYIDLSERRIPTLPPSLLCVDLSRNNIDGEIPSSVCNLSSLKELDLSDDNLDGIIPKCLGNLSLSLLHMSLYMNNFYGKIPEVLFPESCSLRSCRISSNQLEGQIPQSLVNCKDLETLDLGNNKLNDTFPTWLRGLKNLQILDLRSNRFYGYIVNPEVASSFSRLRIIDISDNDLSGHLPMKFFKNLLAIINGSEREGEAEYMKFVYSNINVYYEESISITLKGLERRFTEILTTLTVIDFSNNRFSGLKGPIPSSFGNLSTLESLDLSSNKLQGRIPAQLVNLDFLQVLNISWNNLKGLIPEGSHFDTFTNDSYYGNLGLCGFPLSEGCGNDQGSEPPPTKFDDERRELNWKYSILMGYGCGVVCGLSMGYIVFTTGKPWWFIQIIERVQQKYVGRKIRGRRGRK
ncbi:hypothetical protein DITRI_Ditri06bG0163100 [Diplodiscus trichospermus]